jgi:YfiH family protein
MDSFYELKQIQCFSNRSEEGVLTRLGVEFGFYGQGEEDFVCYHPKQVHGIKIVEAGENHAPQSRDREQADGIYTQQRDRIVAVQTADCLPVLLATEGKTGVMALHAGWRGLTSGILGEGVETLRKLHPKENIYACIGPSIAHCHYEVGPELIDAVLKGLNLSQEQIAFCFTRGTADRWRLDLPSLGIFALLRSGLLSKHISVFRSCTYCFPQKWHSFRRDLSATRRNWSWIKIPS